MDGDAVFQDTGLGLAGAVIEPSSRAAEIRHRHDWAVGQDLVPAAAHDRRAHPVLSGLIRWIDGLALVLTTMLAAWIGRHYLPRGGMAEQAAPDLVAIMLFFLLAGPAKLPLSRLPGLAAQQLRDMSPALLAAGIAQAGMFWWFGWSSAALARQTGLWMALVAGGLIVSRGLGAYVLHRPAVAQKLRRKIAIIGHDAHAVRMAERFTAAPQFGFDAAGIYDDGLAGPAIGSIDDLIAEANATGLDAIIIALPPMRASEAEIANLAWRLRPVAADVFVMPYLVHGPDVLLPVQYVGAVPLMVLQRRPLSEWQAFCKQVFDIAISLLALPPFLLIFAMVALAIKLDSPGPILFRQPRRGRNHRQFTLFKFRSMYTSETDLLAVKQTSRDDPRVTRVGKWLRRLSIDELPQLLNVLRGDMSLVGPRPHAPQTRIEGELLDEVIVDYVMRYKVKPGITGWAQINGSRGQLVKSSDLRKRVTYDLEYIQRWSMGFDVKIIILTALREIFSKHAF